MNIKSVSILIVATLLATACAQASSSSAAVPSLTPAESSGEIIPLKDAKLNIEHNATDADTGFQGFVDSEGWKSLTFSGPGGEALTISGQGDIGNLGLTELFFETVEPANTDVSIEEMLNVLPEGNYTIEGPAIEESGNQTLSSSAFETQ